MDHRASVVPLLPVDRPFRGHTLKTMCAVSVDATDGMLGQVIFHVAGWIYSLAPTYVAGDTPRWYWWRHCRWHCRRHCQRHCRQHCQRWRCGRHLNICCTTAYEDDTRNAFKILAFSVVVAIGDSFAFQFGARRRRRRGKQSFGTNSIAFYIVVVFGSTLFFLEWRYSRCTLETKGIESKLVNAMQKHSRIGPKKDRCKHRGEHRWSLARMVTVPKKKSNSSFKNVRTSERQNVRTSTI